MQKEIIAIDGPAASGKSTIAKLVAQELNYKYIDSGAMYRCVALYMIENDYTLEQTIEHLNEIKIEFTTDNSVYLNGVNVSEKIRSNEVSHLVSRVAAVEIVRLKLVEMQQEYGKDKGIVMDGRDIGTVVFKDAFLKIYQIASVETRALRRHAENIKMKRPSNLEDITKEIQERDYADINRSVSPLVKAQDAIELDSSNLSIEENVAKVIEIFKEKVSK